MSEWKEYTTLIIAALTLVVAIAAFIVALRTLRVTKRANEYARERDKKNLQDLIANKEAQLKSMQGIIRYMASNDTITHEAMLKAEIEQLKQQLKSL